MLFFIRKHHKRCMMKKITTLKGNTVFYSLLPSNSAFVSHYISGQHEQQSDQKKSPFNSTAYLLVQHSYWTVFGLALTIHYTVTSEKSFNRQLYHGRDNHGLLSLQIQTEASNSLPQMSSPKKMILSLKHSVKYFLQQISTSEIIGNYIFHIIILQYKTNS